MCVRWDAIESGWQIHRRRVAGCKRRGLHVLNCGHWGHFLSDSTTNLLLCWQRPSTQNLLIQKLKFCFHRRVTLQLNVILFIPQNLPHTFIGDAQGGIALIWPNALTLQCMAKLVQLAFFPRHTKTFPPVTLSVNNKLSTFREDFRGGAISRWISIWEAWGCSAQCGG